MIEIEPLDEYGFCARCGVDLDEGNGWRGPAGWYTETGYVHHCLDCQEAYFEELADKTSLSLALFYCCVTYNVPLEPSVVPALESFQEPWKAYLDRLCREGLDGHEESRFGFVDGVTDILALFGGKLSEGEFAAAVEAEGGGRKSGKMPGTKAQRKNWGDGQWAAENGADPYTDADYKELDKIYAAISERFRAGGIGAELELTLRNISKWKLQQQKAVESNDIGTAQKLSSMINTEMANAAIRKKDELPVEDIRIDAVVDALEKKGLVKKGVLLPHDKTLERIQGDDPHYPFSKDVVDQILLLVTNTMRGNAGASELIELPEELRFEAAPGEFEEEETPREKRVKAELGLVRQKREKTKEGPGG